jgi:hypothetical protein
LLLLQLNYLTKSKSATGEVISALAANKKATVAFTEKQVRCTACQYLWYSIPGKTIRSCVRLGVLHVSALAANK